MRKIIVTLLAVLMLIVSVPDVLLAEELVLNSNAQIEFDYSDSVMAGTIRYISQVPTGNHFHTEYWPEKNFGRYSGATRECKTSCISMALSYLGIDRTPADMLLANNGVTKVDGWGATYKSVDVNSGMTDYLTGKGTFSPVLIHLPKYSVNGHYILLVDKMSENVYQALDPWECAVTSVQIDGNSATYTKSGKIIDDTIDISGQWYLYKNTIDDNADIKEDDTQAEESSESMEEPKALSKLKITSLTSTSAKLSWKKQSDATGYEVYQKVSGQSYKLVKTVSKNTCKVYVKAGKKYYFKVVPYIQYETQKVEGKAGKCEYFCNKITLSAAGDCTLGVDSRYNNRFNEFYKKNNADYFLKNVKSVFEKDDLTIVNMEGTLTESASRANKAFTFKGKESYAKILTKGSVEVVNMANNHTKDFGSKGLSDTKKALKKEGISYCIGETIAYKKVDGVKVAFLGYNDIGSLSKSAVKKGIETAKKNGAQLVIASFHWGIEKDYYPSSNQKSLGHYAIDQGADLVLGHHPHVLQGIESYKDSYIVYSLGNFCFGGNSNPSDKDTMIYQQSFFIDSNGRVLKETAAKVIPCSLSGHSNYNDFQPVKLSGKKKSNVLKRIKGFSKGMHIKIDAKGNLSKA